MSTIVIAEAGVNHNGDEKLAREMVRVAAAAGADFVKFQTFNTARCISVSAPKATYQKKTEGDREGQFEMVRRLELSQEAHQRLVHECQRSGIAFLSTPFDLESLGFLVELGVPMIKVASGEITNLPLLRRVGELRRPVLVSTGMCTLGDIEEAVDTLLAAGLARESITLLQCNTAYPTPFEDVNLRAMTSLGRAFGVRTGFSDHTLGIEMPLAAVALGAAVIEKHFTLDRSLDGPDHAASLLPDELSAMILGIRRIEAALGDGIKRPSASEIVNRPVARKSIVAARAIRAGEALSEENVTTKRPGTGLSPMLWDRVIGLKAPRDFAEDEQIEL